MSKLRRTLSSYSKSYQKQLLRRLAKETGSYQSAEYYQALKSVGKKGSLRVAQSFYSSEKSSTNVTYSNIEKEINKAIKQFSKLDINKTIKSKYLEPTAFANVGLSTLKATAKAKLSQIRTKSGLANAKKFLHELKKQSSVKYYKDIVSMAKQNWVEITKYFGDYNGAKMIEKMSYQEWSEFMNSPYYIEFKQYPSKDGGLTAYTMQHGEMVTTTRIKDWRSKR